MTAPSRAGASARRRARDRTADRVDGVAAAAAAASPTAAAAAWAAVSRSLAVGGHCPEARRGRRRRRCHPWPCTATQGASAGGAGGSGTPPRCGRGGRGTIPRASDAGGGTTGKVGGEGIKCNRVPPVVAPVPRCHGQPGTLAALRGAAADCEAAALTCRWARTDNTKRGGAVCRRQRPKGESPPGGPQPFNARGKRASAPRTAVGGGGAPTLASRAREGRAGGQAPASPPPHCEKGVGGGGACRRFEYESSAAAGGPPPRRPRARSTLRTRKGRSNGRAEGGRIWELGVWWRALLRDRRYADGRGRAGGGGGDVGPDLGGPGSAPPAVLGTSCQPREGRRRVSGGWRGRG